MFTLPPGSVNLIAFETRFHAICCKRTGSPITVKLDGHNVIDTSMFAPRQTHAQYQPQP
jgi:hypothetical protein